jgi:hypothetical protein
MRTFAFVLRVIFSLGLVSAPMFSQQKGGEDETGPYDVAAKWPAPFARAGYVQGSQGGVFAETPNRIFLANRGELKLPEKLPNNISMVRGVRSVRRRPAASRSCETASLSLTRTEK